MKLTGKCVFVPGQNKITFKQMVQELKKYKSTRPNAKIVVGTDSQKLKKKGGFCFATCIAAFDPGNGGIFYIIKQYKRPHRDFHSIKAMIAWKVFQEASDIYKTLSEMINHGLQIDQKITHHDLSYDGLSGQHIAGVGGWMRSMGFSPQFKPEAVIASGIANMYSKK